MQAARVQSFALEQQLQERENAFRGLETRVAELQQQLEAATPSNLLDAVSKLTQELEQVHSEGRAHRARIQELKATIREGAEQRRELRKQVAEAVSSSSSKPATVSAPSEQDDPEERLLEDIRSSHATRCATSSSRRALTLRWSRSREKSPAARSHFAPCSRRARVTHSSESRSSSGCMRCKVIAIMSYKRLLESGVFSEERARSIRAALPLTREEP